MESLSDPVFPEIPYKDTFFRSSSKQTIEICGSPTNGVNYTFITGGSFHLKQQLFKLINWDGLKYIQ